VPWRPPPPWAGATPPLLAEPLLVDPFDPAEVEPVDVLGAGAEVAVGELLGVRVAVGELLDVGAGELLGPDVLVALSLGAGRADVVDDAVLDSWWKKAMPIAAVPPNAIVVIVPSTAPAARAPRIRTFM